MVPIRTPTCSCMFLPRSSCLELSQALQQDRPPRDTANKNNLTKEEKNILEELAHHVLQNLGRQALLQNANSDQGWFRENIPHNLSKKTQPFTNTKGFPILLNLIVLHHDSFILSLAFLLVRLSIFSPIFLRDFFGLNPKFE